MESTRPLLGQIKPDGVWHCLYLTPQGTMSIACGSHSYTLDEEGRGHNILYVASRVKSPEDVAAENRVLCDRPGCRNIREIGHARSRPYFPPEDIVCVRKSKEA